MTLREIFERCLVLSGQFLIDKSLIELDEERFVVLLKQVIGIYNKYKPINKRIFKVIQNNKQFVFTEENTPEGIPSFIHDIHPMRVSGVMPFFLRRENVNRGSALDIKQPFPWDYDRETGVLTVPVQADYQIEAGFFHKLISAVDPENPEKIIFSIDSLDDTDDELFFEMLAGKFMIGLARSRRAFTLNDLPITNDASELASDGKEMFTDAKEELTENQHKWWMAWRP